MSPPNGVYIVQGESSLVVTAMRRTSRWTSHSHQEDDGDPLLSSFSQLKDVLNSISDLSELEPNVFLGPFLEVIRSEDTTGPITGLALTSVNKFLSYGFIDPTCESAAGAVENIADAVTHARFVGTDPSSDEVVLMKIICVLRTLILCPAGVLLTNESVCEIMQSCFRICFEMRLSELLRKSAEHTLMDMVQLLFTRLPQFREDPKWSASLKKLKMRAGTVDASRMSKRKRSPKPRTKRGSNSGGAGEGGRGQTGGPEEMEARFQEAAIAMEQCAPERIATTPVGDHTEGIIDITKSFQAASDAEAAQLQEQAQDREMQEQEGTAGEATAEEQAELSAPSTEGPLYSTDHLAIPGDSLGMMQKSSSETELAGEQDDNESVHSTADSVDTQSTQESEFVNPRGVRFLQQHQHHEGVYFRSGPLIPYGLPSVRELFRFLVSLTNPLDRHNTDVMIHMGLSLLTVALESGADHIAHYNSLLCLVKDEMCRHLFMLLQTERLTLFAAAMRVCFLLFESMRSHLKFQLEMFLTRLSDIIVSESPRISYEVREIALESIVGLWRIPGLVTELYLNFDCDLYCANVFEDLTKLLSKNAFPVSGLFTTNLLSLDALLTVVDAIEQHCQSRILTATKSPATPQSDRGLDSSTPEVRVGGEGVPGQEGEAGSEGGRLLGPPTSGYSMAQLLLLPNPGPGGAGRGEKPRETKKGPQIRPNRMKTTMRIPTAEELAAIKHKKKVYQTGTELFNVKPAKAISYLQEQGILSPSLDPHEVVTFLKENPKLDKKMIGEYISSKKNAGILEAFVKSFNFEDLRIDEALRLYLETFRLSGEAAVISYVMEEFAKHWHKSNGEPFADADAAFTLAYAIIMLNVDQHNHNVKKQNNPMTKAEFKRNVSKVNGGQDFDEDMLDEIYHAIRGEEIVMPSEHTGLIRENFLWKVLLRRGTTKDGVFKHAPTGAYDHELFTLIWGPTVAALSFVFDKSSDEAIIQKAISGFRKCAMISAHYGMSDVFDNLVISLCKFSTLLSSAESPESLPAMFGSNMKAQLATRTVFGLAHRHGDILREGWKNILDCTLQLHRARLLPKAMIEVEDFADGSGRISIIREDTKDSQRTESGVLSSFYSYFSLSESSTPKGPSAEEQEFTRQAQACVRDCHLKTLFEDSKFLREDSLQELVKSLIAACQGPTDQVSLGTVHDEEAEVFFMELLITVVLCNRDRVLPIWHGVRDFLYNTVVVATEASFLVERAVVGLLRLAVRLLRREEVAPLVLASLRMLLLMKPSVLHSISRQVAYGIHELLRTNAANIHTGADWMTLFTLLEVVGAGANPSPLMQVQTGVNVAEVLYDAGAQSDSELPSGSPPSDHLSDRGYTSDSELYDSSKAAGPPPKAPSPELQLRPIPDNGSWLLVSKEECPTASPPQPSGGQGVPAGGASGQQPGGGMPSLAVNLGGASGKRGSGGLVNQYSIDLAEELHFADSRALLKASETLAFLVRDAAHVTPHNFESCVHAIRTFVEASLNGGRIKPSRPVEVKSHLRHHRGKKEHGRMKKSQSSPSQLGPPGQSDEEGDGEGEAASLHSLSIQLLDLMHTLHTRAAKIFESWAEEQPGSGGAQAPSDSPEAIDARTSAIWAKCWCPLLQGIARLCCDARRAVRSQALTYLQRALLVHDLQTLSAVEWEACFNKVLFPLLTKLLDNISPQDPTGMEETRMRASTLLSKVFLQHLSPLLSLSTFTALWLTILDFMEKYMHADRSDLLSEAIPESLKNMLLVMDTANIFQASDGAAESKLWRLTWDKIDTFLPHLKDELFAPMEPPPPEPQATRMERNEVAPESGTGGTAAPPASSSELPTAAGYFTDCNNCSLEGVTVVKDSRPETGGQSSPRPASPLVDQEEPAPATTYILHPPLPATSTTLATPQPPGGVDSRRSGGGDRPPVTLTTPRPLPVIHDV